MKWRYSLWRDGHFVKIAYLTPEEVEQRKVEGYDVYRIYGQPGEYND